RNKRSRMNTESHGSLSVFIRVLLWLKIRVLPWSASAHGDGVRLLRRCFGRERAGESLQHRIGRGPKGRKLCSGDRLTRRKLPVLDQRIDEHAVPAKAVIQMGSRRRSSRTDAANELSLIDVNTGANSASER